MNARTALPWSEREEMEFRLGQAEADLFLLRAQLRRRLDESAELQMLLSRVLEVLPQGLVLTDLDGRLRSANRAAEHMLGRPRGEWLGMPYTDVFPGRPSPAERLRAGEGFAERCSLSTAHGERPVEALALWIHGGRGEVAGAVEMWTDLSEVERMSRELEEARGFAAMGRLAAVAAHEIRNPLGGIAGFLDLLERSLAADDSRRSHTSRIREGVQALESLVSEFLEFTRPTPAVHARVDLARVAGQVVSELGAFAGGLGVTLQAHAPGIGGVPVDGNAERLHRAVANLVRNAIEACGHDGAVLVAVEAGEVARVRVRDTGAGVDPALASRIFEPFVTGKARGTGLGLALVARTAEVHGGRVTFQNLTPRGAEFLLEVPAWKEIAS